MLGSFGRAAVDGINGVDEGRVGVGMSKTLAEHVTFRCLIQFRLISQNWLKISITKYTC